MVNPARMEAQLILHEGVRLRPYEDTLGNWTIAVGYNITARGWTPIEQVINRSIRTHALITRTEALLMLRSDIAHVEAEIPKHFPKYLELNEVRQRVCLDMAFNMGFRALNFKKTIACINANDFSAAAREMWNSTWAYQVGDGPGRKEDRADRLTRMLLTGLDYTI